MANKGIDISAYQGLIDFNKVKQSGVDFVIIRAGWGCGAKDKYFDRNIQEAIKAGLKVGVYWFLYCLNDTQAAQNAQACLTVIKPYKLDYPIFSDLEYDSISYAAKKGVYIDKATASRMVKIFLDTCKKAGYAVGNYTNLDYRRRYFTEEINNRYDMWLALWGSANALTQASEIWQYSSKGKVMGIVGNVDMDECHKQYPESNPKPVPDVPVNPSNDSYPIPKVYDLVFDAKWYFNRYTDLQAVVKQNIENGSLKNNEQDIAWWLYQHFLMFGMEEVYPENPEATRYGCPNFNVLKYKAAYPDLQEAFKDSESWKPYYYHYMQTGAKEIAEGKRAKVDLSV